MERSNVMVLVHDYWHSRQSIEPLMPLLFPAEEWELTFTEDPTDFINAEKAPDLFVSFKDPIENDQIPTPVWCDEEWSSAFASRIKDGMGFLAVHCALTDLPKEHIISKEILRSFFVSHPPQCPVTFTPVKAHPVTEGVSEFTFPAADEHYVMEIEPEAETEILAYTDSENGRQPALWAHTYGKGRVCALTPGHDTPNLICPEYLKLLKNAAKWCLNK